MENAVVSGSEKILKALIQQYKESWYQFHHEKG